MIIRGTENARKTPTAIITTIHPAVTTIIVLVVLYTEQKIERTCLNGLETKAEAGNAAQTVRICGGAHLQNNLGLRSRLSRFQYSLGWQQMMRRKKESE